MGDQGRPRWGSNHTTERGRSHTKRSHQLGPCGLGRAQHMTGGLLVAYDAIVRGAGLRAGPNGGRSSSGFPGRYDMAEDPNRDNERAPGFEKKNL